MSKINDLAIRQPLELLEPLEKAISIVNPTLSKRAIKLIKLFIYQAHVSNHVSLLCCIILNKFTLLNW